MPLPNVPLPVEAVKVSGEVVEVTSLSRSQVMRLQTMKEDQDAAEVFLLSCALRASEDEIRAWRDQTPPMVVEELLEAIGRVSGLLEDRFQGDHAGPAEKPD